MSHGLRSNTIVKCLRNGFLFNIQLLSRNNDNRFLLPYSSQFQNFSLLRYVGWWIFLFLFLYPFCLFEIHFFCLVEHNKYLTQFLRSFSFCVVIVGVCCCCSHLQPVVSLYATETFHFLRGQSVSVLMAHDFVINKKNIYFFAARILFREYFFPFGSFCRFELNE